MARRSQTVPLIGLFLLWKGFLLLIVLLTPGEAGYDTSTELFLLTRANSSGDHGKVDVNASSQLSASLKDSQTFLHWLLCRIALKLTRWDAIYLVSAAWKGYINEQDWAFSFGYTRTVSWLSGSLKLCEDDLLNVVVHGVVLTNICHLLSVLLLFRLTALVTSNSKTPYLAAILHILAPAGVFLLAPYSEAPFAALSFLGQLLYCISLPAVAGPTLSTQRHVYILASGIIFGLATAVRTNGLFNGLIFAYDTALCILQYVPILRQLPLVNGVLSDNVLPSLLSSWSTILAGSFIALGFMFPQYVAYLEFCDAKIVGNKPPWCSAIPPSIYSSIQARYWNVGFLKYWTVSNAPLFLLAAPMLWFLLRTGSAPFYSVNQKLMGDTVRQAALQRRLALPQLAAAIITLTTAHVQIINRLSSGYALWYILLAYSLATGDKSVVAKPTTALRLMIMYAAIQAALFASFLPPA